ncbi:3-dehydroquinate synthase [Halieaceae bacterium IMCC14734]|uniref:3-dehydroquinate synthase n=1 Tax=Candidatus Litorirhabdus singularis TaxID=2518993 RepID=A0ABT3TEB7_9GAMM|nr:3-dehydroquinate synthase [Candidatus Litorirhabdus singularis]MCX2979772.1 3-dehydroquinate synthase [Candidatus Litorirhabdus singularis]
MHTLHVELGERSYPIYIGRDLLADGALLAPHISGRQVALISNETVAPLYSEAVRAALPPLDLITEIVLPDGEQFKTLQTLELIFDRLLEEGHNRSTTLIALGGGVVGDMVGFAAATYQRGVNFLQIPTTLLSQVDSSVGGKTGVNHTLGKNMIGAFYQPQAVLIDTDTLHTLPERELAAGLAEVIKYGLISDEPFYRWLHEHMPALLAREEASLAEAIERSCVNKAEVVAADEREGGVRAILNFGHTFGHAIETDQGYGNWLHGEAVAAGLSIATRLSSQLGRVPESEVLALEALLLRCGLPVRAPESMSVEQFMELMGRDKKVIDGALRLVLLDAIGQAVVRADTPLADIAKVLAHSQR